MSFQERQMVSSEPRTLLAKVASVFTKSSKKLIQVIEEEHLDFRIADREDDLNIYSVRSILQILTNTVNYSKIKISLFCK